MFVADGNNFFHEAEIVLKINKMQRRKPSLEPFPEEVGEDRRVLKMSYGLKE